MSRNLKTPKICQLDFILKFTVFLQFRILTIRYPNCTSNMLKICTRWWKNSVGKMLSCALKGIEYSGLDFLASFSPYFQAQLQQYFVQCLGFFAEWNGIRCSSAHRHFWCFSQSSFQAFVGENFSYENSKSNRFYASRKLRKHSGQNWTNVT